MSCCIIILTKADNDPTAFLKYSLIEITDYILHSFPFLCPGMIFYSPSLMYRLLCLKGQCHEIFNFSFFSLISSPKPQSLPLGPLKNFPKILGYLQLKVHHWCSWHRWQMEKSSIRKVLIIHFKVSAVSYCSEYLPLVSTKPAVQVAKFAAGVIDTGGIDTGGAPWLVNISVNFQKSLKWLYFQRLRGRWFMKKTWS